MRLETPEFWGTDIDDVLYPTREGFIDFCVREKGSRASMNDLRKRKIEDALGITYTELKCWFEEFYRTSMFKELRPYPDAPAIIEALLKEKGGGLVKTARPEHLRDVTYHSLERDFGHRVFAGIYFTNDHGNNPSLPNKVRLCAELNPQFFIEDNLDIARACANEVPRVFLRDQPWNQTTEPLPGNVIRVNSLTHAYESMNGGH